MLYSNRVGILGLEWRNWQTHGTQNPAAFTVMRVRPPPPAPTNREIFSINFPPVIGSSGRFHFISTALMKRAVITRP